MKRLFGLSLIFSLTMASCAGSPSYTKFKYENAQDGYRKLTIPDLKLALEIPVAWDNMAPVVRGNSKVMYHFRRDPIMDNQGRKIIPNLAIFIEDIPEGLGVVEYSVIVRTQEFFQTLKDIAYKPGLFGEIGGVGHVATYTDPEGIIHKIVFFCTVYEQKGIKIILDGTDTVFDDLKDEYDSILQSLKIVSAERRKP